MKSFCAQCGQEMTNKDAFCPGCGTKNATVKNNKKKIAIASSGVGFLIVVIIIVCILLSGNSAKGIALRYCNAMKEMEGKKIIATLYTKYMDQEKIDEGIEYFDKRKENTETSVISCKFEEEKELDEKEIEKLEKYYDDYYDHEIKISAAKKVTLKVKGKDNKDSEEEERSSTVTTIKVGGKWYISN